MENQVNENQGGENLLLLAYEWRNNYEGDFKRLEEVAKTIGSAFTQNRDTFMVRAASEELLVSSRLPLLYRVQFLVFMAATVPVDEPADKIREHVEVGYYWLDDLENAVLTTLGDPDPRVDTLRESLDDISKHLDDYEDDADDEDEEEGDAEAEEEQTDEAKVTEP